MSQQIRCPKCGGPTTSTLAVYDGRQKRLPDICIKCKEQTASPIAEQNTNAMRAEG